MKINNKALVLIFSTIVLSGCSITKTKTTVTQPDGRVVVTEEVKTSKNQSAIDAFRTAFIMFAVHRFDDGSGALIGSATEMYKHAQTLKLKREENRLKRVKMLLNGDDI